MLFRSPNTDGAGTQFDTFAADQFPAPKGCLIYIFMVRCCVVVLFFVGFFFFCMLHCLFWFFLCCILFLCVALSFLFCCIFF